MRRFLIISFLIYFNFCGYSQEISFTKPDYDIIKANILDSSSIFYYPRLIQRLNEYDTTLTEDEYRFLYYGYTYQSTYKSYWQSPFEQELSKYYRKEQLEDSDYNEIIRLTSLCVAEFPFDLRQLNFMSYVYHLKGDDSTARKISYRFHGTVEAILSSGDGKTCETGFHVIAISHEYVILNLFRFQFTGQSLIGDCDYMEVNKNDRDISGVYFNVKRLWDKNREMY